MFPSHKFSGFMEFLYEVIFSDEEVEMSVSQKYLKIATPMTLKIYVISERISQAEHPCLA